MNRDTAATHRLSAAACRACAALAALAIAAAACLAAPNEFVILSDIHPHRAADRGGESRLLPPTEQLLKLRPAFVIQLGDFCGDPGPDPDMSRLEHAVHMFHRLREAGIDVYPTMGNHDIETDNKINFLCTHTPPVNPELDPQLNPVVYDRWCRDHHYWLSFDRGGIHFVIVDSNVNPRSNSPYSRDRWRAMRSWLVNDLREQAGQPDRPPTLVFTHHPEYLTDDHGFADCRLLQVLLPCPDHTVEAVFGGDWHTGRTFPPESHLGVRSYATQLSVHPSGDDAEYIVTTVEPDRITFRTVDTATGGPGKSGMVYFPIRGRFTSLDSRTAMPVR